MQSQLEELGLTDKNTQAKIINLIEKADKDISHSFKVADFVKKYDQTQEMIIAALLHDVLESDNVLREEVEKEFNKEISFLVKSVSDVSDIDIDNLPKNKKGAFYQVKVQSARKLLLSAGKDLRVILLKFAEQIINLENNNIPKWKRVEIAKFAEMISAPLADRLLLGTIKSKLQNLAFKTTNNKEFNRIKNNIDKIVESLDFTPNEINELIKEELAKNNIKSKIFYRIKDPYSVNKKVKNNKTTVKKLHDLVGFRVITNSQNNCYRILGIVNNLFNSLKIKDYIQKPKPNGYKSIHAIVELENDRPFEIQIRTSKMESMAERGPWAHWHYKESGSKKNSKLDKELSWFKDLAEKIKNLKTNNFEELRINIFQDRIFVYSPDEEIIELPKGSTPIDYAYRIHSDLGNYLTGAKVDGKLVKLSYKLKNGQKVEIIEDKKKLQKRPKLDWLNFVKTNKAIEQIRKHLK
jgi:GTP pyrophosphokinase